jgi:nucleotide-binding universal stress UspA family protein
VVTVWNIPYPLVGFAGAPIPAETFEPAEEEARKIALSAAARAEEAGVETRLSVLRGFPSEEICRAADTYEPRVLVVGSHGWGAFKRAVFGSVSTSVLHHARWPMLVVPVDDVARAATANGVREQVTA